MDVDISLVVMAGICGIVLLVAVLKQRAQFLLAFLVRMVLGAVAICFINNLLAEQEILVAVGLNPVSILTAGVLGISGVALLYGIAACNFL